MTSLIVNAAVPTLTRTASAEAIARTRRVASVITARSIASARTSDETTPYPSLPRSGCAGSSVDSDLCVRVDGKGDAVKKTDRNQAEIVRALRQAGASVQSLVEVGKGCPDILVCRAGALYLMEIKDWQQPPSKKRLTPMEKQWHELWSGPVAVVETVEQALKIVGVL